MVLFESFFYELIFFNILFLFIFYSLSIFFYLSLHLIYFPFFYSLPFSIFHLFIYLLRNVSSSMSHDSVIPGLRDFSFYHKRSQNVILKFQNHLFLQYIFCLKTNVLKTFQECNIMKTKVIWDHFYAKIILAQSFMDWFWWKLVWMLNHKTHYF